MAGLRSELVGTGGNTGVTESGKLYPDGPWCEGR